MEIININNIDTKKISLKFNSNKPFPYLVFDDFVNEKIINDIYQDFLDFESNTWINYLHINQNKKGNIKYEQFPESIKTLINYLYSNEFINMLENISGIQKLLPDFDLTGGGLHLVPKGGFLNIHADFISHFYKRKWRRRLNLIIYLNKDYIKEWGGCLELWDESVKNCIIEIEPKFNRCVLFKTDYNTFHGHPKPYNCTDNENRKSIALYYYTEEEENIPTTSTNYKHRPEDKLFNKMLIYFDKILLRIYSNLKSIFKFDDNFISNLLRMINGKK